MLGFPDLMPDCCLEVSLHSEGPATGQLDQGFPWLSLVPEQMLSWYTNSTLHYMLPMQPSHGKFRSKLTQLRNTGTWPSRLVESQMRQ
jgi:hypothetical protein